MAGRARSTRRLKQGHAPPTSVSYRIRVRVAMCHCAAWCQREPAVNIGILIGHFPPGSFGGAEIQAEGWAERLAERHHVDVVTRRDPSQQLAEETRDGFRVLRTPVSRVPLL